MSIFDKPTMKLSDTVTLYKMPSARVDDGITIPRRRSQPVSIETAKRRLQLFIINCAAQGAIH